MQTRSVFARSMICVMVSGSLIPAPAFADPIDFSTRPAGTSYTPPAPNVIVTFDNSSSMTSKPLATAKAALRAAFDSAVVPDGAIRLAWNSVSTNHCNEIPSVNCNGKNAMRVFDSQHRADFFDWVDKLKASGDTPYHRAMGHVGEHLRGPLDIDSPWAARPGAQLHPLLGCRRAYHIFLADGEWNRTYNQLNYPEGDFDNTATVLPDGTLYDPNAPTMSVYRGRNPKTTFGLTSLSDLAFFYWATDLQPTLENKVPPRIQSPGSVTITSGGVTKTLSEYWNSRNDPATWQHLNMYTVGFRKAATWALQPQFYDDTWTGEDYNKLVTDIMEWPNPTAANVGALVRRDARIAELWHMALNSRGKFVPAPTEETLAPAIKDIIEDILIEAESAPLTSMAASSRTSRLDTSLFTAGYDAAGWSGSVAAYQVAAGAAEVDPSGAWGQVAGQPEEPGGPHTTATLMDAKPADWPAERLVLSTATDAGNGTAQGISWEWASLSEAQKTALKTVDGVVDTSPTAEATAQARLAYLRGDRSNEQSASPAGPFRSRMSRHGDIVNSKLWFGAGKPHGAYHQHGYATFRNDRSARAAMLYVGANDGMLHGFDAATGQERIAYVPEGLHPKLAALTQPSYAHQYYVDGSPFTGDLYLGSQGSADPTQWRTYLAGFLGAGGKGYFVLDVTDPTAFKVQNANSLVILDTTATSDADIGRILAEPVTEEGMPMVSRQITRLNNGRWALVTGNGYGSTSEKAVLLIQYLDGARELLKITADAVAGQGNGLSAPRLIDLNNDTIADVAYAGDLHGNLWKFDLTAASSNDWKVAFGGNPFYSATTGGESATGQPITSAPVWKAHPQGGVLVAFGTGRSLTDADRGDATPQTLYGIRDDTPVTRDNATINPATGSGTVKLGAGTAAGSGRDLLTEQTLGSQASQTESGATLWTLSSNEVSYQGESARKGWFIDLPRARERVLENADWFAGNLIDIHTTVPGQGGHSGGAAESCDPPATVQNRYRFTLDITSGGAPKTNIYGVSQDGEDGGYASVTTVGLNIELQDQRGGNEQPRRKCISSPGAACLDREEPGWQTMRASWRQLQ